MKEKIKKGGELTNCPTCGGLAVTLPCRKGFVPSINSLSEDNIHVFQQLKEIIDSSMRIYEGHPAELDAINYIHQRIEALKR